MGLINKGRSYNNNCKNYILGCRLRGGVFLNLAPRVGGRLAHAVIYTVAHNFDVTYQKILGGWGNLASGWAQGSAARAKKKKGGWANGTRSFLSLSTQGP